MRVIIAEDSVLFREGLVRLLAEAGHEVVAEVADTASFVEATLRLRPDLCIVDIRMPPYPDSDGAMASRRVREALPDQPILMLSQHIETRQLSDLLTGGAFGYLLKDRVLRIHDFLDAAHRVAEGGSAIDPEIVRALIAPVGNDRHLDALTAREREVLALAAEGLSNASIARRLYISDRTVETHMRSIFARLTIPDSGATNRRVLAVLAYLHR